jgi:competence protein ComEC
MSRWPKHNPYFWETAPFFRLLVPLVAGILIYDNKPDGNTLLILAVCATTILALMIWAITRAAKKVFTSIFVSVSLLVSGYGLASLSDVTNDPKWVGNGLGYNAVCEAVIRSTPSEREHTWKLTVDVIKTIHGDTLISANGAGIVYIYKDNTPMLYHVGDTILLSGNWQPVQNAGNPYEFDYAAYCRHNNIYLQQFYSGTQVRLYALGSKAQLTELQQMHNYCMDVLERYIPDTVTMGLIQAMLLGDEIHLDPELRQSFADTGIVHVIAISGGNVMMFFIVIGWLMRWLKHRKYRWVQYVVALPLVWLYVVMAGASPSAIRAAVMFSVLALGFVMDKDNNALNQLLATAFILLCAQPNWLYSLGFQLSFVAVLSLILFYSPVHQLYRPQFSNKIAQWLAEKIWATICASFAAEILVAPLSIYYFHNFPAMFLVANVLAFFFMFAVLILGILTVFTSFIAPVATVVGQLDILLVKCFNNIVIGLQQLSPASFHYLRLSSVQLLFVYLIIAGFGSLFILKKKSGLFIALATAIFLLASLTADKYHSLQQDRLIVYNTPGKPHIEKLSGDHYSIVSADTIPTKKMKYATDPAHVALQAWHQKQATEEKMFVMNEKRILILDTPATTGKFPVDYLVINYHDTPDIAMLRNIYNSKTIILGNNYSDKEKTLWHAAGVKANVDIRQLSIGGAVSFGK